MKKNIIVSFGSSSESSAIKDLAKASGLSVKRFSPQTVVLVATTVMDCRYRAAVSLGIPVVREDFVHEIFERRSDPLLNIDENMILDYKLPRFEGLVVFFAGFALRDVQDKAFLIESYGGNVCLNIEHASHIIVAEGARIAAITSHQHLITLSWLNESIDLGWCANEKSFTMSVVRPKLRRRDASKLGKCESAKKSPSFRKLIDRSINKSDSKKYKRYQQSWELYKHEINTLKTIDLLLRVKNEQNYLTFSDAEIIFGNFELLQGVHSRIVEKLGKVLDNWNDNSVIGVIFSEESQFIESAYIPYFFGLECAQEKLKDCRQRNAKFKAFIENKENTRVFDKNKIDYLLTTPYQELTSRISVLLKEILKNTDEAMPDFSSLRQAVNRVTELLQKANECKKKNFENENIYKQIEHLPAFIVNSSRRIIGRLDVHSLGGSGSWTPFARTVVHALLFDDLLIICRKTLRSTSCVTLAVKQHSVTKKLRYMNSAPIHAIRHVQHITFPDQRPVFVITIRSDYSDDEWAIQATNDVQATEVFLKTIIQQVEICSVDRVVDIERIPYHDLDGDRKVFLKRMTSMGGFSSRSSSSLERSPLGKLRTYSQRLRNRSVSVKRAQTTPASNAERTIIQKTAHSEWDIRLRMNLSDNVKNEIEIENERTDKNESLCNWRSASVMPAYGQECSDNIVYGITGNGKLGEDELVDPYADVKYFSPLRNFGKVSRL